MSVEDYEVGQFGDVRLRKTGALLHERLVRAQKVSLRHLGMDRAGEVRFGRFLSNTRVLPKELICVGNSRQ
jgi:hypothetical protein